MLTATVESIRMALEAIWAHKMRATLTLLGVIVGVATIIASMTIVSGWNKIIEDQMQNALSANVFQVQRYDLVARHHRLGAGRAMVTEKSKQRYFLLAHQRVHGQLAPAIQTQLSRRDIDHKRISLGSEFAPTTKSVQLGLDLQQCILGKVLGHVFQFARAQVSQIFTVAVQVHKDSPQQILAQVG